MTAESAPKSGGAHLARAQSRAGLGNSRIYRVDKQHHTEAGDPLLPHHIGQRGDERRGLVDYPARSARYVVADVSPA